MAELIGTVVLVVSTEYLVNHLQQIFIILMDAEQGSIVGLKCIFLKLFNSECVEEFLYHEKSSVRKKFVSVKILR